MDQTHSIECLPKELLCSIFLLSSVLIGPPHYPKPYIVTPFGKNRIAMPFVVSAVSRHWRQVSIGFPELWSYIAIWTYHDLWFSRTALMLERSSSYPLDIDIQCMKEDDAERLIQLIVPHAVRWRSFQFYGSPGLSDIADFLSGLASLGYSELFLPELRSVKRIDRIQHPPSKLPEIRFRSPLLRRLSLFTTHSASKQWLLDFGNLTHLALTWNPSFYSIDATFQDLMSLLKGSPLLEHLDLRVTLLDQVPRYSQQEAFSVLLSNLVSLKCGMSNGDCSDAWMWLVYINAPKLSSLGISHLVLPHKHRSVLPDVVSALVGHFPLVKTFCWSPDEAECPSFLPYVFEVAPSISQLAIQISSNHINIVLLLRHLRQLQCHSLERISIELIVEAYRDDSYQMRRMEEAGLEVARYMPGKSLVVSISDNDMTWWKMEFNPKGLDGGGFLWKPLCVAGIPV